MTSNAGNQDDYISLESIKNIVFHFFGLVFSALTYIWAVLKRYWMIFVILSFSGMGIGYLYKRYVPVTYKLTMVVEYNELTKMTYYQIFSELNELIKSHSYDKLAVELNLDTTISRQITGAEIADLNGESLEKDTSTAKGLPLLITVEAKTNALNLYIQSALLKYLNNNEYIRQLKEGEKKMYTDKLAYIDSELGKLDSLKDAYTRSLNSGKTASTFYYNAFNPAELYAQSNILLQQKQETLSWFISKEQAVKLINGFKEVQPEPTLLLKNMTKGFIFGLIVAIWIVFWEEIRGIISEHERKKNQLKAGTETLPE